MEGYNVFFEKIFVIFIQLIRIIIIIKIKYFSHLNIPLALTYIIEIFILKFFKILGFKLLLFQKIKMDSEN